MATAYLPKENGLTLSAALAEAAYGAPASRAMLNTFELWHASMSAPVRIVVDEQPLSAVLEADAPRNPGEDVVFLASRVTHEIPEESDQAQSPEIILRVDNVTGYIADALRTARSHTDPAIRDSPWQLIERVYASDDLTAPHILPVFKVTARRVVMQGPTAVITAAYRDSANTSIPAQTFTPTYYSGLLT